MHEEQTKGHSRKGFLARLGAGLAMLALDPNKVVKTLAAPALEPAVVAQSAPMVYDSGEDLVDLEMRAGIVSMARLAQKTFYEGHKREWAGW